MYKKFGERGEQNGEQAGNRMGNKHEEQRGEHDRFWGTRLSSRQSGESKTEGHMSKCGTPYLRRSVWLSAIVVAFKDPAVNLFY